MTIVYAVSAGSYSDYHIVAMFSSIEKAESFMRNAPDSDYNDIERFALDPCESVCNGTHKFWFVRMDRGGGVIEADPETPYDLDPRLSLDIHNNLYGIVLARDRDHAIKIMGEKRMQWMAENKWPEDNARQLARREERKP